ncbi:MAG: DUF3226 domain-containing protein [Patescibacteria group bacterium]
MPKTIIITESTDKGVDKKLLSELIKCKISDSFLKSVKFISSGSGSISDVRKELRTGLREAEFINGNVKNLLIIVDADENPKNRFEELKNNLLENSNKNFNFPDELNILDKKDSEKINVGIFLFPDCENKGSFETLCLRALKHDKKEKKFKCIKSYFGCLQDNKIDINEKTEDNKSKSKFRVFMATPNPDRYVDSVIDYIDLKSDVFNGVVDFIRKVDE